MAEQQFNGVQDEPVDMPECSCCEFCDPNTMPAIIKVKFRNVVSVTAEPAIFNKRFTLHRVRGADSCLYEWNITFGGDWLIELEFTSDTEATLTISGDDNAVFTIALTGSRDCSTIVGEMTLDSETAGSLDFSDATAEILSVHGNSNFCCEAQPIPLYKEADVPAMDPDCCCGPADCTPFICGEGGGTLKTTYRITITGAGPWAGVYDVEFCHSQGPTTARCWWIFWPPVYLAECAPSAVVGLLLSGAPGGIFIDVLLYEDVEVLPLIETPSCMAGSARVGFGYIALVETCDDIDGTVLAPNGVPSDAAQCAYFDSGDSIYTVTINEA